ncbi:MAG: tRNA pseudouridine(38-40) synthase TruA [Planctomycetes bacterium]|nr:tRNA pseudouridine(38-40) synthase TruA [Planctomycetota bacterium]
MPVRNIKLTIAYDGTEYHGWQIQPGLRTIQGVITEAIQDLLGSEIRLFGASRTDAGVSALGQVGLIQIDSPIPTENLARAITGRLPADIAITEAVEVPQGFDLMGAVTNKLYRYTIFTGQVRPVLKIRHCWHLHTKLDITAMSEAAKLLVGKKDFKSFASVADKRESSVRTIFRCDVGNSKKEEKDLIYVDVEGDGFLYNMVRNIVGTLVDVGKGRWKPEKINEILEAKDRTAAGQLAPPQGLCLMWIKH